MQNQLMYPGVHPRLLYFEADVQDLKKRLETDASLRAAFENWKQASDTLLEKPWLTEAYADIPSTGATMKSVILFPSWRCASGFCIGSQASVSMPKSSKTGCSIMGRFAVGRARSTKTATPPGQAT